MINILAILALVLVGFGYFLVNKNTKYLQVYNVVNIISASILTPYSLIHKAPVNAAINVFYGVVAIIGFTKYLRSKI